ncbi:hypothetical protein [Lysinibacillus sp. JNUCC-52]|uniref:hypothetical protein n=1 Tax=Lysinibacillus sp. JNUCC-52 TaxID=2792480 RepID=UPI0019354485|nr:hypothetical protein JNUCC52_17765 [Lysinibacillus sp. JNUCC-52]
MMQEKQNIENKVVPLPQPPSPTLSSTLPNLVITSTEAKERIDMLQEFVKTSMVRGIDYGAIDGFSKPTLLKPGAEKLCDAFGFLKTVDVINRIEQWDIGIFSYEVKVTLSNKETGVIEVEGIGLCNSKEAAFRFQDPFTIVNTLLKMAKKRALIDAVLSATRASGLFTQDIEDFPKPNRKGGDALATEHQLKTLYRIVEEMGMPNGVAKEMMKIKFAVDKSTLLTKQQVHEFIQDLLLLQYAQQQGNEAVINHLTQY